MDHADTNHLPVTTIKTTSAEEYLEKLSLRGPIFGDTFGRARWLFRGQANSEWHLIPSALREGAALKDVITGRWEPWSKQAFLHKKNAAQVQQELESLCEFFWMADEQGLPLPDDGQKLRSILSEFKPLEFLEDGGLWPPDELLSLLAIAQHHGLPTRLLDWTKNPFIAAYFSVQGEFDKLGNDVCVWAFNRGGASPNEQLQVRLGIIPQGEVVIATAPSAGNRNLLAQEGLFLVHRPSLPPRDTVLRQPLETVLYKLPLAPHNRENFPIYKFVLPKSERRKLLKLLHIDGINASTMFPGFDGVVRAIRERSWWA